MMKGTVALRKETKKFIDNADVKTVKMIHALLEAEQESDWWDDLAPAEKASIERGLKDVEEGRVVPHETVMKKYKKWRLKQSGLRRLKNPTTRISVKRMVSKRG
jgi:predicted transcriptional regulator